MPSHRMLNAMFFAALCQAAACSQSTTGAKATGPGPSVTPQNASSANDAAADNPNAPGASASQPSGGTAPGTGAANAGSNAEGSCSYALEGTYSGTFSATGTLNTANYGAIGYQVAGSSTVTIDVQAKSATIKETTSFTQSTATSPNPLVQAVAAAEVQKGFNTTSQLTFADAGQLAQLAASDPSWKAVGCAVPAITSRTVTSDLGSVTATFTPAAPGIVVVSPDVAALPQSLSWPNLTVSVTQSTVSQIPTGTTVTGTTAMTHEASADSVAFTFTSDQGADTPNGATPAPMTFTLSGDGQTVQTIAIAIQGSNPPAALVLTRQN